MAQHSFTRTSLDNLFLHATVMLPHTICSLLCERCLFSPSHCTLPFLSPSPSSPCFPLFPSPLAYAGPHYGVGFDNNRPSINPSVGSPPSLQSYSTGALSVALHSSQTPPLFEQTLTYVAVKSKFEHPPHPHQEHPRHWMPLPAQEGGHLISTHWGWGI